MADRKRPRRRVSVKGGTGASINEIALQLKAANPQMKFEDAQARAKEVKNAQATMSNNGGAFRHGLLTRVLGKGIGGSISASMANKNEMERSAQILAQHNNTLAAADPSSQISKQIADLVKKVDYLYTEVRQYKAERLRQPAPASFHQATAQAQVMSAQRVVNGHMSRNTEAVNDAVTALQGLGFKKAEAHAMIQHVPANVDDVSEIVRMALKAKDNIANGKATKLTPAEVPAAVEAARPAAVEAARPEAVVPAPAIPVSSAQIQPVHTEVKNDDVKEAATMKMVQHQIKVEKEQKERDKEIEDKLDKIMKGLMNKNLNQILSGLLSDALAWLGKKLLGAFASTAKWVGEQLLKVIGKIGSAIKMGGKQLWKLLTGGLEGAEGIIAAGTAAVETGALGVVAYGTYRMASGKDALEAKSAVDKYLEQYGIKVERDGKGFTNGKYLIGGKEVDAKDLTQAQKDVIGFSQIAANPLMGRDHETMEAKARMKAHPEQYTKAAISKVATAEPAAAGTALTGAARDAARVAYYAAHDGKSAATASSLVPERAEATESLPEMTVVAPVINKTIVAGNQDSSGDVVIKTRNDESSFAGPTAQLFDHPVSFAGVYSM
jgi:hypothetical protein